jgi:hypothetical protein
MLLVIFTNIANNIAIWAGDYEKIPGGDAPGILL